MKKHSGYTLGCLSNWIVIYIYFNSYMSENKRIDSYNTRSINFGKALNYQLSIAVASGSPQN